MLNAHDFQKTFLRLGWYPYMYRVNPPKGFKSKAERAGFEPAVPCGTRAFQARALGQLRYLSERQTILLSGTIITQKKLSAFSFQLFADR